MTRTCNSRRDPVILGAGSGSTAFSCAKSATAESADDDHRPPAVPCFLRIPAVVALSLLGARIKDQQERDKRAEEAATRKSLVGSGDRSDRIRTYNFPQGRVTDHRIGLTLHKIAAIMDGDLDDILDALAAEHQTEQLAALAESAATP